MAVPVDLREQRKKREQERYRDLVLKTFDDFEHADKRELLDRRAAVERANRQKL